jgi:superfamily I DNA/RNA helicase
MAKKIIKIAASPGTGKTTYLLNIIDKALKEGTRPEEICFTTFSKAGANEARSRAIQKFNLSREDLKYFTTLHSMCFRALGLSKDKVFSGKILGSFARQLGLHLTWETEEGVYVETKDDKILSLINYNEVTKQPLEKVWEQFKDNVPWHEVKRVADAMQEFKSRLKLISYNDMIIKVTEDPSIDLPKFKYLLIDEAQDCSTIQWNLIKNKLLDNAEIVYITGDPDQAIFAWAGADVNQFIDFDAETITLDQSYRCPRAIQSIAGRVAEKITKRINKTWKPIDSEGETKVIDSITEIDMSEGSWLILARNKSILNQFTKDLILKGYYYETKDTSASHNAWKPSIDIRIVELVRKYWNFQQYGMIDKLSVLDMVPYTGLKDNFLRYTKELQDFLTKDNMPQELYDYFINNTWHEGLSFIGGGNSKYIQAMIARGEKLFEAPRIRVSTIHSVKGGEAENVVLSLDMSFSSYKALQNKEHRDQELRVLYVGLTRASKRLFLVYPKTNLNYLEYLKK